MIIARLRPLLPLLILGFTANIALAQLYEADTGSGRILEFTPAGVESTFASGLDKPVGLAFDPSGNLYVSAAGSGKILKFTFGGVKSTFASGLNNPWGLAFDASGNLFVSASGSGQILKFAPDGAETTFASGLSQPLGLAFDAFGNLFVGTSTGAPGGGEILKFTPSGAQSTFATGLFTPSSLAFDANGNLYAADSGAAHIYQFTPDGAKTTFASGSSSLGLAIDATGTIFSSNGIGNIFKFSPGGTASTFASGLSHSGLLAFAPLTSLYSFDFYSLADPSGLIQATNGNFYGTTQGDGNGTVFELTPGGTLTTLHFFCTQNGCPDGADPQAGLIQASNGDLYGTTAGIGSNYGTVFRITPSGAFTNLYTFCTLDACADGQGPSAGLVQATNGELYGTTAVGGAYGQGTVFKITTGGALTRLYSFCSQAGCLDGANPNSGLVQASNGELYGTTAGGGEYSQGTVFKITPGGTLTTLYTFCSQPNCTDGKNPNPLIQATNGELYGTTNEGGTYQAGTVFKITPGGVLSTIYSFCAQEQLFVCVDGGYPLAGLVEASNGNLYGTTAAGGAYDGGMIFEITPSGTFSRIYSFLCTQTNCADGEGSEGGLVQSSNGKLYGTTLEGGVYDKSGTIFSLSVGLGAFVKTLPTSGKVGETIKILGNNLTGATSVTFNGIPATFTVNSSSEISTTVPVGATTGKVEVLTPGGTLSSNVPFRVP